MIVKKLEFINELGAQLHSMPAEEVRPLLDYYMEIVPTAWKTA